MGRVGGRRMKRSQGGGEMEVVGSMDGWKNLGEMGAEESKEEDGWKEISVD
jgi:hypothetical protein